MTRVKRGIISMKRRRNILAKVKGARYGISRKEKKANEILKHAGNHAFAHRKRKKSEFRKVWNIRINAAVRPHSMNYSTFMNLLKKEKVGINRKMLATLAQYYPESFNAIIEKIK